MSPALVVKLRPVGPWRSGPDSGARNRVDPIYHSDSLYAAVTAAMSTLGVLDEWLEATARNPRGPAVRFSSCFPFIGDLGFVVPPRSMWPPAGAAPLTAAKVRWKAARFVPLPAVAALLNGQPLDEEQWTVDGVSECLVPTGRPGPFRVSLRWSAAVDRLTGSVERHSTACLEFRRDAGLWAIVSFDNEEARARWSEPVRGAFRLLADSGFGGERSRGWGRCADPEFVEGTLPELVIPRVEKTVATPEIAVPAVPPPQEQPVMETAVEEPAAIVALEETAPAPVSEPVEAPAPEPQPSPAPAVSSHWLLSLFTPAPEDGVDWKRGNYTVVARGGRVESPSGFGARKKQLHMISEGSVLVAGDAIRGTASDVAPDGFAHPVFRAGFALSIPLPEQVTP
ncbi:MAG: hypothetical protein U0Q18_07520 [Bryobacteraceae bacterium]